MFLLTMNVQNCFIIPILNKLTREYTMNSFSFHIESFLVLYCNLI
jgi:hypothetical protein